MDFQLVLNQIIVLFIILFVGLLLRKRNIIDAHSNKKMSSLVVNITGPVLVVSAMMQQSSLDSNEILLIMGASVLTYIILFLLTIILPKIIRVPKADLGIYKFMIMFSNVAFMGFPVISAVLGEDAIFYAAIFNLPFSLLVYTLGIYFVCMNQPGNGKFNYKKMINPGVISVGIGLVIMGFKLELPAPVAQSIHMIGGLTTPLSMLVIGASLSGINVKSLLMNVRLYTYSIIKLIVIPMLFYFVFSAIGFKGTLLSVAVLLGGMPVAANSVIISNEYGGNEVLASEGVFISTMLSILTIPLLAFFMLKQ